MCAPLIVEGHDACRHGLEGGGLVIAGPTTSGAHTIHRLAQRSGRAGRAETISGTPMTRPGGSQMSASPGVSAAHIGVVRSFDRCAHSLDRQVWLPDGG